MENPIGTEIPNNTSDEDIWNTSSPTFEQSKESDIANFTGAKVDSLKETVEEINEMISQRNSLSLMFIKEAEGLKTNINNFLLESAPKGEEDSEFVRERSELRKKQIELSEIQLNEKVSCWSDVAMLKRELRDRESELNQKESRSDAIRKILE